MSRVLRDRRGSLEGRRGGADADCPESSVGQELILSVAEGQDSFE